MKCEDTFFPSHPIFLSQLKSTCVYECTISTNQPSNEKNQPSNQSATQTTIQPDKPKSRPNVLPSFHPPIHSMYRSIRLYSCPSTNNLFVNPVLTYSFPSLVSEPEMEDMELIANSDAFSLFPCRTLLATLWIVVFTVSCHL
jgi:hypothetical protein